MLIMSLAAAPIGRATDIAGRIFTKTFAESICETLSEALRPYSQVHQRGPSTEPHITHRQEAATAIAEFGTGYQALVGPLERMDTRWCLRAGWDGAVAASCMVGRDGLMGFVAMEQFVPPAWEAAAQLARRMGGYGPTHLVLSVKVNPPPFLTPPEGSIYAAIPEDLEIRRWTELAPLTPHQLSSLHREFQRAAGTVSFEPETP
jgi:hypothetical protein